MTPAARVAALSAPSRVPAGRERLAIVGPPDRLESALTLARERLPQLERPRFASRPHGLTFTCNAEPGRLAFLFPGQGSEFVGMLGSLMDRFTGVRAWLASLDRAAEQAGASPLSPLIVPSADAAAGSREGLTDLERSAQLGTVADLALHEIVTAMGLRADAYVGHSNGEHPAVIAAGRVNWDRDALCRWFVKVGGTGHRRRGTPRALERLVAVSALRGTTVPDVLAAAGGPLFHAMDNSPTQQVIGGERTAADAAARLIVEAGGIAAPLGFDRAYHTPLFADWAAHLAACYDDLPLTAGRVPVYSCLTGAPLPVEPDDCRRVMAHQWTSLVRFRAVIERLYAEGFRTFVEVGPDAKLTAFVDDTLRGRPHVVVSASSVQRSEFDQLFHLAAELFAGGCAVNPAVLGPAARPTTAAVTRIADLQRQLLADARESLARGEAAWRTVRGARAGPALASFPLLGPVIERGEAWIRTRRTFTRQGDPFVDDHAFGRRPLAEGAYPLPVIPFTGSLEIAVEAAAQLAGGPVREVRDARASRWLALDFGRLTIDAEARRDGNDIAVRIREEGASLAAAFECVCATTRTGAPAIVPVDPQARPPRTWNARAFYERYAFHGPSFRGLSAIRSVGPSSVDADITIGAHPSLPPSSLVVDPAMLDCAGQMAAFWLLEQGGLEPEFGIFPYALRRAIINAPPAPIGTRLRARAHIARQGGTTEARVVFETLDGNQLAALDGLMQRLMPLPRWLATLVFGGARHPGTRLRPPLASLAATPRQAPAPVSEVLTSHFGIWRRVIAHICATPAELEMWGRMPADRQVGWLLEKLALDGASARE